MSTKHTRREFMGGALASLFALSAPGRALGGDEQYMTVRPPMPDIKGSLGGLTMRADQEWPKDTHKLVYFGTSWNTGCGIELYIIQQAMKNMGPKALEHVTPVFVYPKYDRADVPEQTNISTYIRAPDSPFLEIFGPPDKVMKAAENYRARYFDAQKKPIRLGDTTSLPFSHTRFTYLMDPNMRNVAIFEYNPFQNEMEGKLGEIIEKRKAAHAALDIVPGAWS